VHEAAVEEHAAQEVRDLRGHGPVPVLEREEVVGALRAARDVEERNTATLTAVSARVY